ncbi:helix-turn-helix domain-containing protein [Chryseobacterium vrystaatense]|uniref:Helix-turn-helix domain-containing protein n=1 Tax=Chryseobacterium vrystaatense TaxID=307480 RepID=A0A1M5PTJ0_9FLAO|nr:helix-turn-helix domain-containing protein [Chryseobacterium vrystaatense]SHH05098.1 Helix-turn-helix domain-containing protein [Chryseobacterium vrystaatense]
MEITIYKPLSPLLKAYIDCFYILTRQPEELPNTYLTFPSMHHIVCLYADAVTEINNELISIHHESNGILQSRIVGKFSKAVCARYEGPISEITTLFKPLAVNAFLPSPLKDFVNEHFSVFNPYPDFLPAMRKIQDIPILSEKVEAMEAYWISKYQGFQHPFLPSILDEMTNSEAQERSITAICKSNAISRQTLYQHFDRYLCKTPSEFRKIIRFRRAINTHRLDIDQHSLTTLSLLADYFDQSHMIRDFKELTGYTPKYFFNRISHLGDGSVNWLFL